MGKHVDGFFRIKGPEESLQELEALIGKHGEDAEKFGNDVAKLASSNAPVQWNPREYKDYIYPAAIVYSGRDNGGVLELDMESYINTNSLSPEHISVFGRMLEAAFPGIDTNWLYRCDEGKEYGFFAKGGKSINEFWPANYVVECGDLDIWVETLEQLAEEVEDYTGTSGLVTFEDCVKALEVYSEKNKDDVFRLIVAEIPLL